MTRSRWIILVVISGACTVFAIISSIVTGGEAASVVISVPILAIAAATLWYTVPQRARLHVDRLDEADPSDLIFFIYPQPNPVGEQQIPRDYLLQLHVAVSNLGGRKAVLSSITIEGFRTQSGQIVHLPGATATIGGMQWIQRTGWLNTSRVFENMNVPGPYILEPDDVIVIRFRTRRGIDWSSQWTSDSLHEFCQPLQSPIIAAFGTMVWRRAGEVVRDAFTVPMKVEQQTEYVNLVDQLTQSFAMMPVVPEQPIALE